MAGDSAGERGGFAGLSGQLSHLPNVLDMSIAGHPGTAVTYGRLIDAMAQKTSPKRSSITDYFGLLSNANVKGAVVIDFETMAELEKKDKEKRVADNERGKAKNNRGWESMGYGKKQDESDKPTEAPPAKRKWTKEEWAARNKKEAESTTEAKPKANAETDTKKNDQESK